MINILDKILCCGCEACVQRCPSQCISMKQDNEGFLYPKVNLDLCVDCHLCEKVCPVINQNEERQPIDSFAAKNVDNKERTNSSSGGLFILFAKKIISKGGVVFGAVFNDAFSGVHHTYSETMEGLIPMTRSKYVQSQIGKTFIECEKFLKEGRKVMFTGTPCEIAGLNHFLRESYDNLLTVEVVCHAVPSPLVWKKYLKELDNSNPHDVNFRDKSDNYSWHRYGTTIKYDDSTVTSRAGYNTFMRGFLANLYIRPSCSKCPAKVGKSGADITLGDFWGIKKVLRDFNDKLGVSLVLVHSEKASSLLKGIEMESKIVDYDTTIKYNSSYIMNADMSKDREAFYKEFNSGSTVSKLVDQFVKAPSFMDRVKYKLKSIIKR